MPGFLLIDKPINLTSHDVIDRVRRITGERRVGHAGTLDPFATGLLIVGVGREATREMQKLSGLNKTYQATFVLGASSDTDDTEGKITTVADASKIASDQISQVMQTMTGQIDQIPPAYAAIKIGGKKMYEAARAGQPLEAPPRKVRVERFELLENPIIEGELMKIQVLVECSSGTYIRALARDLGQALRVGGYASELRRTAIGPFDISISTQLSELNSDNFSVKIIPVEELLERLVK